MSYTAAVHQEADRCFELLLRGLVVQHRSDTGITLSSWLRLLSAAIEPASNLQVLEVASKSIRITWDASIGEATGYKVQMIPMMAGNKRQELYVGPGQTSVVVRDLSPDVEYQISLYALKGLTPSEPVTVMQKTQPVKVSVGEDRNPDSFENSFLKTRIIS